MAIRDNTGGNHHGGNTGGNYNTGGNISLDTDDAHSSGSGDETESNDPHDRIHTSRSDGAPAEPDDDARRSP